MAPWLLNQASMQTQQSTQPHRHACLDCGCDAEKIRAVHAYLNEHFPCYVLGDFHAPTRSMQGLMKAPLPDPHIHHHVVSVSQRNVLPYYAVLLNEFQAHSEGEVNDLLQQWDLAGTLGASRIAVVSKDGVSSL